MFQRKFFYYLVSISFMTGLYWGVKNASMLFPSLVESFTKKPQHCLALPKTLTSEKLKAAFANESFEVQFKELETSLQLQEIVLSNTCEFFVFPSRFLKSFTNFDQLLRLQNIDFDLSKISPDFLGLKFDRTNARFIPIAYKLETPATTALKKHPLSLYLLAAQANTKEVAVLRRIVEILLSVEGQRFFVTESKLGTVLRDSEIDVSLKSSAVRQLDLREITIVEDESE